MNRRYSVVLLWLLTSLWGDPALAFAQEEPAPTPTPRPSGGGGGGITINFPTPDWNKIIADYFNGLGKWINDETKALGDAIWNSGINVVGHTDIALTFGFGPIQEQMTSLRPALLAIMTFALVLIGLKTMIGSFVSIHSDTISEIVDRVLMAVVAITAFPVIVPQLFEMTNNASQSVGTADYSGYLAPSLTSNAMIQAIFFIILLFFIVRLFIRGGWRMGFLAIMAPVGLLACALFAIPPLKWVLGWWATRYFGMLFAQTLSVLALTIGIQFVARGGIFSYFYAIAFVQLATEILDIFGRTGEHRSYGPPWTPAMGLAASFMSGGGAAAAATAAGTAGASATVANTAESASQYGY